jgi:UDP-N-acetylglucosamine acyltransferase
MAFVHVGHDAKIGNYVTIANQTAVAGHVVIEDRAVLSACVLIHQFCRIGQLAMIGGRTILTQDVPPYCMLAENCRVCGPNVIGMRRAGMSSESRLAIHRAIKSYFFKNLNGSNALNEIESETLTPEVAHFVKFIRESERGIMAGESELAGFLADGEL